MTSLFDKGPRISRISIGRLHNLGNYEHVRYEVTVDLPPGTSPAAVLNDVTKLLGYITAKPPHALWRISMDRKYLAQPATPQDGDRATHDREEALRRILEYDAWERETRAAMLRFNDFGGTREYHNFRDHWEDDQ